MEMMPMATTKPKTARAVVAGNITTLAQLISARRRDLGKTQAEIAKAVGFSSPEFIGMVEGGIRTMDLNKIPRLADALQLDRADLCRMALYEEHPSLFAVLFGQSKKQFTIHEGGATKSVKIPEPVLDFLHKFYDLPAPLRNSITIMVESLYSGGKIRSQSGRP